MQMQNKDIDGCYRTRDNRNNRERRTMLSVRFELGFKTETAFTFYFVQPRVFHES